MKKLALVTLVLLAGLTTQAAGYKDILLSHTRIANLKVNDSKLGLSLGYPGKDFSGICGIEIRSNGGGIEKLAEAIKVVKRFDQGQVVSVVSNVTIDIDLSDLNGAYGVWLTLETKDGSTLKQTIDKALGEDRTVIAVTRTCQ